MGFMKKHQARLQGLAWDHIKLWAVWDHGGQGQRVEKEVEHIREEVGSCGTHLVFLDAQRQR
jgi:hypothetical protein